MHVSPLSAQGLTLGIAGTFALGRVYLQTQRTQGRIAVAGDGMGLPGERQTLTLADTQMQDWLRDRLAAFPIDGLQFEGSPRVWRDKPYGRLAFIDEIDGSQNQFVSPGMLPFSAVCTLVDVPEEGKPEFHDIIGGVVMNYLDGSTACAYRQPDGGYLTETIGALPMLPEERRPKLTLEGGVDLGNHPLFADTYYPEVRLALAKMFEGRSGNVRSLGNSAWEAVLAAFGYANGYFSTRQKFDEVGALWAIARGARAYVRTLDGNRHDGFPLPLGEKGGYELLIAPTEALGQTILLTYQRTQR